ncbi:MAG: 30S ribosome-binding factor RbfA [Nocardioidaceae bacterium]|nr:30S ribosome-binding factor RbfA [Nocardioidaceae bacterium]
MASPRVRKIADRIKVIVAEMLERRIKDPRLGFVTVTEVRMTGDAQNAVVYYTVLGEDADQVSTAAALESAKGVLRSELARQLGMRTVPSLAFQFDGIPEAARHLDDVLAKAREADAAVAAVREGAQPAGEADPYKKPREIPDEVEDSADGDDPA